jgi:hypothetical protein
LAEVIEHLQVEPIRKITKKTSLYVGGSAGFEFNDVKNQGITKAGLQGGILLGMQFNHKISIETGVQFGQKKYYSQGKYFHPKTGTMPPNMTISSLEGTSSIIEIPVSVKFNFSKKQDGFYGKAGISNYVMTKEQNNYKAMVSGFPQDMQSTYKKKRFYPAAGLHLSAGYQMPIGKSLNLRAEPYIQVPLCKIGIGSLPVKSAGLNLIIIRN